MHCIFKATLAHFVNTRCLDSLGVMWTSHLSVSIVQTTVGSNGCDGICSNKNFRLLSFKFCYPLVFFESCNNLNMTPFALVEQCIHCLISRDVYLRALNDVILLLL